MPGVDGLVVVEEDVHVELEAAKIAERGFRRPLFVVWANDRIDAALVIREAESVTLFSIFPQQIYSIDEQGNPTDEDRKKERFHGFPVFGKIAATGADVREKIRSSLLAAVGSVEEKATLLGFDPRHGVCLRKGDRHIDLLICFECEKREARYLDVNGDQRSEMIGIGLAGRDALNQMLDSKQIQRDVPIAKKARAMPPASR